MKEIMLYSHDPGGANAIFPLVRPLNERGYKPLLFGSGPSLNRYAENNLMGKDILSEIGDIKQPEIIGFLKRHAPDFIITGTSFTNPIEKLIWTASRSIGISSYAIVDNWMNYRIRFLQHNPSGDTLQNEGLSLPSKICVMDEYAKTEAINEGLPKNRLLVTGHPYFQFLKENSRHVRERQQEIRKTILSDPSSLLVTFISEPIAECYKTVFNEQDSYLGYTEKSILGKLYKTIGEFSSNNPGLKISLALKLHPKEEDSKYEEMLNKLPVYPKVETINLRRRRVSNWELIMCSDLICGMASMLLLEAFLLEKPILSVQIGLKKDNPFILDKMNIVKSVLDENLLYTSFENAIANKNKPEHNFIMVENPIDNIIGSMEKILC